MAASIHNSPLIKRAYVRKLLSEVPCVRCGTDEEERVTVTTKVGHNSYVVSQLISSTMSLKALIEKLNCSIVVCKDCRRDLRSLPDEAQELPTLSLQTPKIKKVEGQIEIEVVYAEPTAVQAAPLSNKAVEEEIRRIQELPLYQHAEAWIALPLPKKRAITAYEREVHQLG